MNKLKVGDIVGEFNYGHGVGEVVDVLGDDVLVTWYEWSLPDSIMNFNDLELEPNGGW
jgi:hypothetical protein